MASDDHTLAKQIENLHSPDARNINVRPLLRLVEEVIEAATQTAEGHAMGTLALRDRSEGVALQGLEEVTDSPLVIEKVHSEITTGPICGLDTHTTAIRVLEMLSHFPWEAKVVLTMAAFALTYGDFWLLVQIYATNPLAKSMALIKGLPMIAEHVGAYKRQFEAISNLIKSMLETTKCIVEFGELPTSYISTEDAEVKAALNLFPTAVYWVIRSAVAAATQISILTSTRLEILTATTEAWELSNHAHKLKTISDHLRRVLTAMYKLIDEKMEEELYRRIRIFVYEKVHMDNIAVLKVLISEDDSVPALYDCQAKRRVHLDNLSRRNVLLLISGLDITHEELYILEQAYTESRAHAYEIVWIPVVDQSTQWTDAMRLQFETLQASMPWYTVHDPKIIRKAVIKFFRQDWHFYGKPILVVIDPQGRVVSPNAIHMMWIWQSEAFPFTSAREEELWQRQIWNLELLVDAIDQRILEWIREGKYIILYGGDNLKWIRDFTTRAKNIARDLRVPVEMVYVGKSHHKDMVQKLCSAIAVEQLSHCWQDPNQVWYFWTRLESMFHSKMQLGRMRDHSDITLQELQRLQSFDKGHEGWAILAKGSNIVVNAHGRLALTVVEDYEKWEERAKKEGLEVAFAAYYQELYMKEYICSRIEFPFTARMPDHMLCPDCRREMQKFKTFRCCHEDAIAGSSGVENSPPITPYET